MRIHTKICYVCGEEIKSKTYFLERIVLLDGIPTNEYICDSCRYRDDDEVDQGEPGEAVDEGEKDRILHKVWQRQLSLAW